MTKDRFIRVTVQRSGGFAGIMQERSFTSDILTPAETDQLTRMIKAANFFDLPGVISGKPLPDRFQYRLVIELDGKQHTVTVPEQVLSTELRALADWIMKRK